MRLLLLVILALQLPSKSFADGAPAALPQAAIAGEVETPARFELAKAATLGAIFSEVTKPLRMGATRRIRLYRNGACRMYDLKTSGDVALIAGDVIEVPTKGIYEGQGEAQDWVTTVSCEDAETFIERVANLKSDLWKVGRNWHDGIEGIEFRPIGESGQHGGVWVFVRPAGGSDVAQKAVEAGSPTQNHHAFVVISRDFGRGIGAKESSAFESAVIKAVVSAAAVPKAKASIQPSEK